MRVVRVFQRVAALAAVTIAVAGCAGYPDRAVILDQLSPAPMTQRAWSRAEGSYVGPLRSTSLRGGFEGQSVIETRIDLSGWVDNPAVTMQTNNGFSTAWAMYGERKGLYTNVPAKRYGSQGTIYASTHAPDQLLLILRRFGASAGTTDWLIITFHGDNAYVDVIGHSGWRGEGELWKIPQP